MKDKLIKVAKILKLIRTKVIYLVLLTIILVFFFWWQENDQIVKSTTILRVDNIQKDLGNYYLSIPKINVVAPVLLGVDAADKQNYDKALEKGVAQIGTAFPGEGSGNIFIYGHSSATQKSPYQSIFATLNELIQGDEILINYQGKSYNYVVKKKKIVQKNDLSVLNPTKKETLTLMTCWPVGTNKERLVVSAERK